ncbi:hypothetical protein YC2023_098113 [Brassica napus]
MFSPVVRDTFIRVLLALVARQDLELEQFDVKTVFLHGELEEIYMTQPDGCRVPEKNDYVCTLHKSLCGFKQALRGWYKRLNRYIIKLGYIKSPYDWCVCVSKLKDATFICLVLYVDDMLLAEEKCDIEKLKLLGSEVEMKDLGAAKKILGMEIFRDREKEFLSQKAYINEVLTRFVMSSGEHISTLCTANDHLTMYMV